MSDFVTGWNTKQPKRGGIKVMSLESSGDLYGIEIRFPGTAYVCTETNFATMEDAVARRSGGTLLFSSSRYDFLNGVISLSVACCNHSYDMSRVEKTLELLLTEMLPELLRK